MHARKRRVALALLGLVTIPLVVATSVVVVRRVRVERTRRFLESLRSFGNGATRIYKDRPRWMQVVETNAAGEPLDFISGASGSRALDAWGHPMRVAIPGPVHTGGWDVWSFGPDGVDECGAGDDIVVGENLWPVPDPAEVTKRVLDRIAQRIRSRNAKIHADGSGGDETGLRALSAGLERVRGGRRVEIRGSLTLKPVYPSYDDPWGSTSSFEADDGWSRVVRYRCPGPVHPKGWDLWSFGPDGIDDQGRGDDVLLGED